MLLTKNRIVAAVLTVFLAFSLSACGDDDDPTSTVPGGSVVTEPVGS